MSVFVWIQGGFLLLRCLQKSYHTTGSKEGICDEAPWCQPQSGLQTRTVQKNHHLKFLLNCYRTKSVKLCKQRWLWHHTDRCAPTGCWCLVEISPGRGALSIPSLREAMSLPSASLQWMVGGKTPNSIVIFQVSVTIIIGFNKCCAAILDWGILQINSQRVFLELCGLCLTSSL